MRWLNGITDSMDMSLSTRTLEAGERWARLAQARAASRPGLCAIAPGRDSRGEAKDSALLSSRDAGHLEPPERPQGSVFFIFLGSTITTDGDCSHEIKRRLLLGRKVTTNLDSILKSRDIILPTKVHLVKAMVFPVVMYGCESWTINKVAAAAAKSLQSCPTLSDPMACGPPGSSVHGISQARVLEWDAIAFSD